MKPMLVCKRWPRATSLVIASLVTLGYVGLIGDASPSEAHAQPSGYTAATLGTLGTRGDLGNFGFPPFGQSSGAEIFNGLKARGDDAFVLHKTFPNEVWSLWWLDKTSNTSYTLTFDGDDVITIFEPVGTFNKSNVTAAQNLAAMADKLIPWAAP